MPKFSPCNCVYSTCIPLEKFYRVPVSPHAFDTSMLGHGRLGATSTGSLQQGIQEGVNNMGNKRVVADSSRCIGCQTCMAACIEAHDIPGNIAAPRLRVTRTYEISAPVACHHCEDAPCAKACPTGALFFDPKNHRIGVNEDNCIGCKSCVMACPFGAVSVATTQVPVLMGDVRVGSQTKSFVLKCDLCVDRPGGPACAEACPTKGLTLVDEERLAELIAERARATIENEA